ncbi:hypothetical protein BH10ACT1_BH10ACT1_36880 [soil metagenome]
MTITSTSGGRSAEPGFESFVADAGQLLRRALIARYGLDVGLDLHAEALERAWRDWERVGAMANPTGYLWRTAVSGHRRYRRWSRRPEFPGSGALADPGLAERDLFLSLGILNDRERVAVVMVHAHQATYQEVAELLGVPTTTVTNLVHRGLAKLRNDLQEAP